MITMHQIVAVKDILGSYESDAVCERSTTGNYHTYVTLEGRILGYQEARNSLSLLFSKDITDDNIRLLFREWEEYIDHYARVSRTAYHQLRKDICRGKIEAVRSAVAEIRKVVGEEWVVATIERRTV